MASPGKKATTELAWAAALAAALAGCGGAPKRPAEPVGVSTGSPVVPKVPLFAFDSLDARPVSSDAARGKVAVLSFVTTGDLASQAQLSYLIAMAKHDGERVYYATIALHERRARDMVEAYVTALKVPFPAAIADPVGMNESGPFGEIHTVPTTVVLDKSGRLVFKKSGLVKSDELRAVMHGL
jgi:hypothetical protein